MTVTAPCHPVADRIGQEDFVALVEAVKAAAAEASRPRLLIPQEAVPHYLGISRSAFFRIKSMSGFPKPVNVPTAGTSYRRADLDNWVAKLRAGRSRRET